jgi:hypothetical protein
LAAVLESAEAKLRLRRIEDAIRVRGLSPPGKLLIALADTDPSSVADFVRDTFSHKGRREKGSATAARVIQKGTSAVIASEAKQSMPELGGRWIASSLRSSQ